MSGMPLLTKFALALVLLWTCGPAAVRPTLVAYYSFDGASVGLVEGLSGYCPNVVSPGTLSGTATIISGQCKYGDCLDPGSDGSMQLTQQLFQGRGASANSVSFSLWVRRTGTNNFVYILSKRELVGVLYVPGGGEGGRDVVACTLVSSTKEGAQATAEVTLQPDINYHIACVYNGLDICVYVNHTLASGCKEWGAKTFSDEWATMNVGSAPGQPEFRWPGTIDELKIYDHALSSAELALLSSTAGPNDAPSVRFEVGGNEYGSSYTAQVFSNFTMTAVVNDSFKAFSGAPQGSGYAAGFTYKWQALSDTCGGVMIKSPTLMSTQMVLEDVGTSTLKLCVSDGEIARETILSLSASASTPQLIRQPSTSTIQVPAGTVDFAISVEGSSLPPPSYQWQQLVNVTVNRTSDVGNLTTRGVDYHSSYLEESLGMRTAMFASRGLMMAREEVEVEEFRSIPGATYGTLLVNGTEEWDGSVIRCLVYTTGGGTFTNNFTVVISEAIPSSTGGDSDGALIGGIVGGVGGGLLLCLLLLLVIAVVLMATRRRRATAYRKLKQPDYEEVAFGDVKGDVTLPKKQAEGYRQLEQLLANPDHRLALAICEVASIGERDAMYRALLRVLAGQFQAYNLIARTIKLEVASADEEGTLFRSNSAAAKLFTLYMRMIGLKYLFHVLVLSVRSLHDNAVDTNAASRNNQGAPSASSSSSRIFGHTYRIDRDDADGEESSAVSMDILGASSMELDPQKLDEASDLDINTLELWLTAQKMFKLIMQSEKILPQELRLLIRRIHDDVAEKFSDEAVFRAMGGFFFLRLICPALLAPQLHGLLDEPPHPMAQRQLILVTKVLQNLANDTLPGAKEAYMERLNAFIVSNKPALGRFYDQIVDHPDHGKLTDLTVPARVRNDALIKLRAFLEANLAGVEARLRDQGDDDEGDDVVQELRDILDKEPVSPIERV